MLSCKKEYAVKELHGLPGELAVGELKRVLRSFFAAQCKIDRFASGAEIEQGSACGDFGVVVVVRHKLYHT